ncbi:GTPase IMAP member 4 [Datura stramonium]|uniref:GTPase IMAP member 4 n=1 Tax=Datura stramonium TaxID=4076 RepID=A0ABS8S0U2_DATST|nr:GTPase IMAP member 4 [Datura stramonium]
MDTSAGDTVLEKNQTQEEITEEVADLVEAMSELSHVTSFNGSGIALICDFCIGLFSFGMAQGFLRVLLLIPSLDGLLELFTSAEVNRQNLGFTVGGWGCVSLQVAGVGLASGINPVLSKARLSPEARLKNILSASLLNEILELCDNRQLFLNHYTKDPKKKDDQLRELMLHVKYLVLEKNSGLPYSIGGYFLDGDPMDEINELQETMSRSYKEQLRQLNVESKLKDVTRKLLG